ncbi:uncharacterized protein LOC120736559 [Simochromis diagramma]|uniref:uncharacterized protein LOC120736559 n=1 Tax=Simochromis diagramma TaxID=43689 RepID=UPI001A7F0E17|nr:uncharacterized protein LOC120736559 [Simochromis diagramma]
MAETKMTMRLIVNEGDIRKLTVKPRPNTIDDLINWIKTTIQANYEFTLQYDEPEFDNAPVNLRDMSEVPEKPTIRIIPIIMLTPVPVLDSFSETSSQADTEILSVSSSSVEVRKEWPDPFIIPKFSVSVEYQLRQGNLTYLRDATYLKISKDLKHCILDRLAEAIYSYKAYPEDKDIDDVAKALVAEHPCLKERGSSSGYQGWKNSLKFKMGNYRNDMRKLGHPDVTVNAGKRGKCNSDGEPPHKNIKKPRKGEVNYLPDFPEGMDSASLETAREAMVDEMKKKSPDVSIIKHAMNITFALRRAEVVKDKPDISQMVQRWPALFTESQVNLEFNRITGKSVIGVFFSALDGLYPGLEEVFTRKTGRVGQELADLRKQKQSMEPTVNRCYALRGLPIILGDNASKFFTSQKVSI